jgi:drug/metabolite transporter (DMT)-like permease
MSWLLMASLLWAFSFGLIKRFLPELDPWQVAAVRLALAAAVLAPWSVRRAPPRPVRLPALALGAVQFGLMYVCYLAAYRHLAAWQIALWTVLTPLLVVLMDDLATRRLAWRSWLAAALAVGGALLAQGRLPSGDAVIGILLVQASNAFFAAGQLGYRRLAANATCAGAGGLGREAGLLGWMYLGAVAPTLAGALWRGADPSALTAGAAPWVLLYLGLLPTAAGFWLWNRGAARTGTGALAVANNLKVPLGMLVAWLVFGEAADHLRAAAGMGVIIAALALAPRHGPTTRGSGPTSPEPRCSAGS